MPSIDWPDLPLVPALGECVRLLGERGSLALSAEPGSGKTTLLPIALMEDLRARGGGGAVLMAEPRRVAAVQAASRIASLLGEEPGARVGYAVRGERRGSRDTRILCVTEGVLLRMIQDDPSLSGFSAVVFDEFHERSVGADLSLALCLDARASIRSDLALVLMSATLDAQALAAFLSSATGAEPGVLEVPGAAHPVEIRHEPADRRSLIADAARSVARAFSSSKGDVLVFLPGVGEIERLRRELPDLGAEVLALHGSLPLEDQRRVVRGGESSARGARRRIILSTSVAQSSLTVPGVRAVVDAGLARLSRYDPGVGMDGLFTERVSGADADQRAGRAGREDAGTCVRLWSADEPLQSGPVPEILRADLASLLLECLVWGSDPSALPFLDAPPPGALFRARSLLGDLRLLDAEGRPNAEGRRCAALGAGPRLGAMLIRDGSALACACAALLSERDRSGIEGDADIRHRIEAIAGGGGGAWADRARRECGRLMDLVGLRGNERFVAGIESAGDALALAYPDRVARLERNAATGRSAATGGLYRFPSGRTARLAAAPGAHAGTLEGAEWIVAPDVDAGQAVGVVRAAAPLGEAFVRDRIVAFAEPGLDIEWKGLSPKASAYSGYGKIRVPGKAKDAEIADARSLFERAFIERLEAEGLSVLPWNAASRSLLERARWCLEAAPGGGRSALEPGSLDDESLASGARDWLIPYCALPSALREGFLPTLLSEAGLLSALSSLIAPLRAILDREAPASIALPSGRSVRVDYGAEGGPAIEGKVQEFFGLAEHPLSCGKPILIRLLSPAGRPVQSTRDIAGFWKTSYAEVRKDMRGRYPKHDWPEDGSTAPPSSGPKRRR